MQAHRLDHAVRVARSDQLGNLSVGIDDTTGRVVAAASELEETLKTAVAGRPKKERARAIGKAIGDKLVALNIKAVVFDRNGYIYHGRVKEIADGARDAGLAF